jgi:hypothetical protein
MTFEEFFHVGAGAVFRIVAPGVVDVPRISHAAAIAGA